MFQPLQAINSSLGATANSASAPLLPSAPVAAADSCTAHDDEADEQQLYVSLNSFWYGFLAFITTLGLLVALVSNMIIIYLFTKTPCLRRNPTNIIAVNLSLSDLLYCAQWPSVIYCSLTQSTWILEISFVCQTFGFITVSTALASILTVLAMSIERAIVITYSIHAKSRFTIRAAWCIVVLIWILSICSCLPPLFGKFNRYTLDPSKTSCTLDYLSSKTNHKLYILVLYFAYWIAPTVIITICYSMIIITFKRSSRDLQLVGGSANELNAISLSSQRVACGRQLWRRSSPSSSRPPCVFDFWCDTRHAPRDSLRLNRFAPPGLKLGRERVTGNSTGRSLRAECVSSRPRPESVESAPDSGADTRGGRANSKTPGEGKREMGAREPSRPLAKNSKLAGMTRSRTFNEMRASAAAACRQRAGRLSETAVSFNLSRLGAARTTPPKAALFSRLLTTSGRDRSALPTPLPVPDASGDAQPMTTPTASTSTSCHVGTSSSQHSRTGIQIRLAKMSFYLILLWLISWTPIASLAMINSVVKCHHRASALAVFTANTMTKLGPTFDVFIYGISHPKIKSKFKQIIRILTIKSVLTEYSPVANQEVIELRMGALAFIFWTFVWGFVGLGLKSFVPIGPNQDESFVRTPTQ